MLQSLPVCVMKLPFHLIVRRMPVASEKNNRELNTLISLLNKLDASKIFYRAEFSADVRISQTANLHPLVSLPVSE